MKISKVKQEKLSQEKLKRLLHYNPETGVFTWIATRRMGRVAGTTSRLGYIMILIDGMGYISHRLAWMYMYGYWPLEIDHLNRIRNDNRIENLREVSHRDNCRNMNLSIANTSGHHGVHWMGVYKKWQVRINTDEGRVYCGCFDTLLDAVACRKRMEKKHNYHANHGKLIAETSHA